MLSELEQLLACRRERESRAAATLRQARHRFDQAKAALDAAYARLNEHHRDRKARQDQLYKNSLKARLTKHEIDGLNIELDLMGEQTDALTQKAQDAEADVNEAARQVEDAAKTYHRHRRDSDRWGHLVDEATDNARRQLEQTEEFAIEDDLSDRRMSGQGRI